MICMVGLSREQNTTHARVTSWRRMRKASHEAVNKLAAHGLHEHQVSEALALARSAIQNPSAWNSHVRRAAASLMLSVLYGEPQVGTSYKT